MKIFSDEIANEVHVLQNIINNTLLGFKSFYVTCEDKYKSLRRRIPYQYFLNNQFIIQSIYVKLMIKL